jgi:hypothetical protein
MTVRLLRALSAAAAAVAAAAAAVAALLPLRINARSYLISKQAYNKTRVVHREWIRRRIC